MMDSDLKISDEDKDKMLEFIDNTKLKLLKTKEIIGSIKAYNYQNDTLTQRYDRAKHSTQIKSAQFMLIVFSLFIAKRTRSENEFDFELKQDIAKNMIGGPGFEVCPNEAQG